MMPHFISIPIFALILLFPFPLLAQVNYSDSETGPLNTVLPAFSEVNASPSVAHRGQIVSLTFTSTKILNVNPEVVINGRAADFIKKDSAQGYTYAWEVLPEDSAGSAAIFIQGADSLGNTGEITVDSALEIVTPGHGLPLYTGPACLSLLIFGILAAARKRKKTTGGAAMLLFLSLFAAASLWADPPQVSNVRFTQGPDGKGGTKVDIYYDLVAPNGPCTLTATLSKDAGEDGFIYPVTSVAGDVFRVDTGSNHHMVWAVAEDYPNEDIPEARIRVTAEEAFSLVFMTDTHVDMKCSEYNLQSIAQWIVDQAASLNICYVGHLGDVGDERGTGDLIQMHQKARTALQPLINANIPLSVAIGNHDYGPVEEDGLRCADTFNRADTFGRDFYNDSPWFQGTFEEEAGEPGLHPGGTINHYIALEVYGCHYLFLTLEYYPRDKVLDWADTLVQNSFPDHEVIVSTHAYLNENGLLSTSSYSQAAPGPEYSNSGASMWERYFKYWKNLRLILNGHFINTPRQNYLEQTGVHGNTVHSHFFNYQNWGYKFGSLYYVTSYGLHQAATLRILTIYPSANKVVVKCFTPSAGKTIEAAVPETHIFCTPLEK